MKKFLTGLFAVAVIGLGVSQATAGEREHQPRHHGHNSGFSFGVVIGDPYWDRDPIRPVMRGCTVQRASAKARDMGIRHQTIFKSPHTLKVVGSKHGHRVAVTFARQRGCPIIRY